MQASDEKLPVVYREESGIAIISLNRPHRLNAIVPALKRGLRDCLDRAVGNDVGAILIRGEGRSFCAGRDMKQNDLEKDPEDEAIFLEEVQEVARKVHYAPMPIVAAVQGYALGGGCELALACDLVVAAEHAQFGFPEVGVGRTITGGVSQILPLAAGLSKAKEMIFLSEHMDASEALSVGLVNWVVPASDLDDFAFDLAVRLAGQPRDALRLAKRALNESSRRGFEDALAIEIENAKSLIGGEDSLRAGERFRERSRPQTIGTSDVPEADK